MVVRVIDKHRVYAERVALACVRKERRNRPELLPRPAMHARLIIEFRVEFFTRDIQLRHSPDGRSNSLSLSLSFSLCVVVGGKLARMFALCASPRERGGDGRFTPTIFAIRRPKRPPPPPPFVFPAPKERHKKKLTKCLTIT